MIMASSSVNDAAETRILVDSICNDLHPYLYIPAKFQDRHILQLAQAIHKQQENNRVTHLHVAEACEASAASISTLLRELSAKLTKLQIEDCSSPWWIHAVATAVRNSTTLTTLALCKIEPSQMDTLIDALLQNRSILVLDLSRNQIEHCHCASRLIRGSTTLTCLMLNNNLIQNIEPLAAALRHNHQLKMLSLADNRIADLAPLSNILETTNFTLERMYLHGNRFSFLSPQREQIGYYLQLNHAGRRLLRGHEQPAGLYPHILGKVANDPSILYGLLQELPQAWTR